MQNLIEKPPRKKNDNEGNDEEKKQRPIIKSATDLQRLKLEKLMKNPDKPIIIPETPREKDYMQTVPSFVRNVMGSSAGAGSGEFHVYRHLRRKEYARQKCIHAKSMREQLDDEYQSKLEKNRMEADAKTAKKRAKRLKKKQRAKKTKIQKNDESEKQNTTDDDNDDDEDKEEENEHEEVTEDTDPAETRVANDDVEICKDTAGPQPKEEKSISPNKKQLNQDEVSTTCSNTDEKSDNNPETDKKEEDTQKEIEEFPETKEDQSVGKQEAKFEEETTEEHIKDLPLNNIK